MQEESLWIVHEDASVRSAVARLAGITPAWSGGISDAFPDSPAPSLIIMPLGPQIDAFAGSAAQMAARFPHARWILLRSPATPEAAVQERFVALRPAILCWPPPAAALRRVLAQSPSSTPPDLGKQLAERRQRDLLVYRFARAFSDLNLPTPPDNLDPILILGERGTGRLLMAHVIHALSQRSSLFVHLPIGDGATLSTLQDRLSPQTSEALTICIDGPEKLQPAAQRELAGWIELGPPSWLGQSPSLRWIFIVEEPAASRLDPDLEARLSALLLRIPPLRERPGFASQFAEQWLLDWARAHESDPIRLSHEAQAAVGQAMWPGNLRELEEALQRAVSQGCKNTLSPVDLALNAAAPAVPSLRSEQPVGPIAHQQTQKDHASATAETSIQARSAPQPLSLAQMAQLFRQEIAGPVAKMRQFMQHLASNQGNEPAQADLRFQLERDLERMRRRFEQLDSYVQLGPISNQKVNLSTLIETLLEERRDLITQRGLLVLRELEDQQPYVIGDFHYLHFALSCLLEAVFDTVADRDDVYVACRFQRQQDTGSPTLCMRIRFHPASPLGSKNGHPALPSLPFILALEALGKMHSDLSQEETTDHEYFWVIHFPAITTEEKA